MKKTSLPDLPATPGVYLFWQGKIPIYIGKAINLKNRVPSYFDLKLSAKSAKMVESAERISIIRVASELEALLLEASLIKKYQPKYNFIAKDDKHALYIKITKEKYPRVITVRKNDLPSFGPFPSSNKVHLTLRMLRKIFPFADHKLGKRPCIYSQIGLCNPCPNGIERIADSEKRKVEEKKYKVNIKMVKRTLGGKFKGVITSLKKIMANLAKEEKFEEATKVRNQIEALNYITQPTIPTPGFLATASMVTFVNGEAEKSLYRRFKVNSKTANCDTASLAEIAKRRANNLKAWGTPDLIFVDGGKAQVNAFKKVFDQYQIPIVAITKGRESLDFSKGPALNLVVRIRDESHRFAQKYHNLLFKKNLLTM